MTDQPTPQPMPRGLLCPYCGAVSTNVKACLTCGGLFEPLSRQATQNSMGPWFIRDDQRPFMPGCAYEVIRALVRKGKIAHDTIIRGPTTNQFWAFARRTPGVAHLMGLCHACATRVPADSQKCPSCDAHFSHTPDRQNLGLGPEREVPSRPTGTNKPPVEQDAPNTKAPAQPPPQSHGRSAGVAGLAVLLLLATAGLAWGGFSVLSWVESSQQLRGDIEKPDRSTPIAASAGLPEGISPEGSPTPLLAFGGLAMPEPPIPDDDTSAAADVDGLPESTSVEDQAAPTATVNDTPVSDALASSPLETLTADEAPGSSAPSLVPMDAARLWLAEDTNAPDSVSVTMRERQFVVTRAEVAHHAQPVKAFLNLLSK